MSRAAQAKNGAVPLVRTPKQEKALVAQTEADALKAHAARLAQVVNLHIAGYSLVDIGTAIGASEAEVDRMLSHDTARYIRSQPALRLYVRNWISERYTLLLDAVWDDATDPNHKDKFEAQTAAVRILDRMERLHGASAPTQSEVKVDAAPEAVEKLVAAIAASQGLGYETDIFDTIPGEVVHEAVAQSHRATEVSGNRIDKEAREAEDDDL